MRKKLATLFIAISMFFGNVDLMKIIVFPQLGSPLWGLKEFFLGLTVGAGGVGSRVPLASRSGSPANVDRFPLKVEQ